MPSIVFWPGQPGGTAEYRCHIPGRALARRGWDVTYVEHLDVSVDGHVRDDPDVLVVCRIMDFYLPDAVRRIRAAGRTLVVFDTDDWFLGVPSYNPASRLPHDTVGAMHAAMREADLITCSTKGLAQLYRGFGRTAVLPNLLDPELWDGVERYRTAHDKIRVGWLAAWNWRGGDVEVLRPWLRAWLMTNRDVEFVALGCPEIAAELGIPVVAPPPASDDGKHLRPFEEVPAMVSLLDVGLAPLADNTFNWRGKSACKGLEYNAAGVPVIASPSEAYRGYVQRGVNGYLARRDWAGQVERTIRDLDVMREGARKVAARWFIDDHIDLWVAAYEKARACR